MAKREGRTYARIVVGIWQNPDFVTMSAHAQLLYLHLFSSAKISAAGVHVITERKWARTLNLTEEQLSAALGELCERRFIVVDERTEELLVRTFVRHDGGTDNPNRVRAVKTAARAVESSAIMAALAVELERVEIEFEFDLPPSATPLENRSANGSANPSAKGQGNPSMKASAEPSANPSPKGPVGVTDAVRNPEPDLATPSPALTGSPNFSSPITDAAAVVADVVVDAEIVNDAERPEIDELCDMLADRIEANGARRPTITKGWRTQCRLMLDTDGRSVEQVAWVIDWSQRHPFWHTNILGMPKLRAQFDQLVLKAQAERQQNLNRTAPRRTTDDKVRDGEALSARFAAEEAAEEAARARHLEPR